MVQDIQSACINISKVVKIYIIVLQIHFFNKISSYLIAELYHINRQTAQTIRRTYSKKGLDAAIKRKKRDAPPVEPKITGEVEARIIALCCSTPPEGRSKWSLRLLADKSVELEIIDSISHEAISRLLKKRIKTSFA